MRWDWLPGDTPTARRLRVTVVVTNLAHVDQAFPDFIVYMRDRNDVERSQFRMRAPEPRVVHARNRFPEVYTLPLVFSAADSAQIVWIEAMAVYD